MKWPGTETNGLHSIDLHKQKRPISCSADQAFCGIGVGKVMQMVPVVLVIPVRIENVTG
jgi:hypothetical protein